MTRFLFALYQGWRYRQQIRAVSKTNRISDVIQLKVHDLLQSGIRVLVLDFDGVLAPHGRSEPDPEVEAWLETMKHETLHLALLSNKPNESRRQYFQNKFPHLLFVSGFPKKPYPQGLLFIMKHFGVNADQVILVDDRLLTGVLATCLSGARSFYVSPARQCFATFCFHEFFFELIRHGERFLLGIREKG